MKLKTQGTKQSKQRQGLYSIAHPKNIIYNSNKLDTDRQGYSLFMEGWVNAILQEWQQFP